jgi:hypothetical protein
VSFVEGERDSSVRWMDGCDAGCVQASLVDLTVDVDLSVPERRTSAACNVVERPVT